MNSGTRRHSIILHRRKKLAQTSRSGSNVTEMEVWTILYLLIKDRALIWLEK